MPNWPENLARDCQHYYRADKTAVDGQRCLDHVYVVSLLPKGKTIPLSAFPGLSGRIFSKLFKNRTTNRKRESRRKGEGRGGI
jgi:hypothetical protein